MKVNREREKGVILPFLAVALPVLIGGLGLVIDNSAMYELKRRTQTAADAGALAGAHELKRQNYALVTSASVTDAKKNGFQDSDDTDSKVIVNRPPIAGRHAGDNAFVEVIVEERAPLFFMRAFMEEGYIVRSRAVAGARPDDHCAYALNSDVDNAFQVAGATRARFNCGVQVNSRDSSAATTDGGAVVEARRFDVAGDYDGAGFLPDPHTGQPPMTDPLAELEAPEFGACDYEQTRLNEVTTIGPGVYCNGIEFRAQSVITMQPGVYVINGGGIKANAGAVVRGEGVMIYITAGPGHPYKAITLNGGADVALSAPTAGPYQGVLIFEDRELDNVGDHKFSGGAGMQLSGAIYTPNAEVGFGGDFDTSLEALKLMLIADTILIRGNPTFAGLDNAQLPINLLVPRIVE